jgi:acyl carrier protein
MASSNSLVGRLTRIFREVFDNDSIILRDDMTSGDIEGWDSLSHIDLLYAIENEFGIVFTIGEAGGALRNLGELRALIEKKTAARR